MLPVFFVLLIPAFQGVPDDGTGSIAARVNDEIITRYELDARVRLLPQPTPAHRSRILRSLAEDLLLQQEARRHDIAVTDEEVTAAVERDMKRMGGEEKLAAFLRFRRLTTTQYREEVRNDLLVERLYYLISYTGLFAAQMDPEQRKKLPTLVLARDVSPEEVREYYQRNRERFRATSRVMVQRIGVQWKTEAEKPYQRRLAESLRRRLLEGYDFNILAMAYSDACWTSTNKPDGEKVYFIPDLTRDNSLFTPETTALLFDVLPVGEYSAVVADGNYFNLFRVAERTEQKEIPFEEAQILIREQMRSEQQRRNKRMILEDLTRRADYWPPGLFQGAAAEEPSRGAPPAKE